MISPLSDFSPEARRTILQLLPEYRQTTRQKAKIYYQTNPRYRRMGVKVAYADGRPPRYGLEPEEAAVVAQRTGGKVVQTRAGAAGGAPGGQDQASGAAGGSQDQEAAGGGSASGQGQAGGEESAEAGAGGGSGDAGPNAAGDGAVDAGAIFAQAEAEFDGLADQVARLHKDPEVQQATKNHTQRIRQTLHKAVTQAQPPLVDGLDAGAFQQTQAAVGAVLTKSKTPEELAEGVRQIASALAKRAEKTKDPRGVGLAAMALAKNLSRVMWETLDAGDWVTGRVVSGVAKLTARAAKGAVGHYVKGVAELGRRAVKLAIAGAATYGLGKGTLIAFGALSAVGAPGLALGVGILGGLATVAWALGPLHAAHMDFVMGLPFLLGGTPETGQSLELAWPWLFGSDKGKGGSEFPLPDLGQSGRLNRKHGPRAASREELVRRGIVPA